ncbi:MAG: peroxiredoxin family protein [Cytophagales bacterium]
MNKNRIFAIAFALIVLGGYWGYKTFLATPCLNFEEIILQKDGFGDEIRLASLQEKVTLVAFFQTWCIDCIKEMPTILALESQIKNSNLKVIMVSDEPIAKLEIFKQRFPNFAFQYYLSKEKLPSFGIRRYPTTYLVDEKGNILKSSLEGNNWASAEIVDMITKKLN